MKANAIGDSDQNSAHPIRSLSADKSVDQVTATLESLESSVFGRVQLLYSYVRIRSLINTMRHLHHDYNIWIRLGTIRSSRLSLYPKRTTFRDGHTQIHFNQPLKFNSKSNCLANSASLSSCSLFFCNSLSYSALGLYVLTLGCGGDTDGMGNGELLRNGLPSFGSGNGEEYLCIRAGSDNSPIEPSLPKNGRCPGSGVGGVCPYAG